MNPRIGLCLTALLATAPLPTAQDVGRSPVQRSRPVARGEGSGGVAALEAPPAAAFPAEFRSIDGVGNNLDHPRWGAAGAKLLRLFEPDYADGAHAPAGPDRASPRAISNAVHAQAGTLPNAAGASDFLWAWGQFLDHDVDETPIGDPAEPFDIPVPAGDPWFDPSGTGAELIPLDRSSYDVVDGVRQQVSLITAFIDASNVYGSDAARAAELRTLDGTGRLKTSAGDLPPFNVNGFPNAPNEDPEYFLAGDVRANEQVVLTVLHTLFVREHNHWAARASALGADGELAYQIARAVVGAEMQAITYREFLPVLLGRDALVPYAGYRAEVNATVANGFATAGYRVGHTLLSPELLRLAADGAVIPEGNLALSDAFFQPDELSSIGVEPYLRGLCTQRAQEVDPYVIDALRNFLFGPPGAGGFDLVSLNIQRGRDHGLPAYCEVREKLGLAPALAFADVCSDPEVQADLASVYRRVEDVDAWVGLLSEDHAPAGMVGPTLRALLANQFERLRDGDRFWYETYLPAPMVAFVERQTLAAVIRRNSSIGAELPDDVFHAPAGASSR